MPYSAILSSSSWLLSGSSPVFQCLSQTGAQCSVCGLKSAKYYEIITFLDLLAVLLLIQARVCLAARTGSWLMFSLLLTRAPSSFSAKLNLSSLYPQMMTQFLFIAAWTPSPQQRALFIFTSFCTRSVRYSLSAHQDYLSTTWDQKNKGSE